MTDLTPSPSAPAIFAFVSHSIRVVFINGDPWFVLRDLLDAMESKTSTNNAIESIKQGLGEGYSNGIPLETSGGIQEITIVAEAGATYLVSRSNTDTGRRLNRFLHAEVLPAIRKTGRYETQNVPLAEETLSQAQYHDLKRRVGVIGSHFHYSQVAPWNAWSFLRRSMGVASAHQIPASRYEEARRILDDLNQAAFAFKGQVMECERRFFKRRFGAVPELSAIEQDPPQIALRG